MNMTNETAATAARFGLSPAVVEYVRSIHYAGGRRLPPRGSESRELCDTAVEKGFLRRIGLAVYCTAQGDHL